MDKVLFLEKFSNNFKSPEASSPGSLKLFSVAGKMIFTLLSRDQCDHMIDFDFYEKILIVVSLFCKF